MPTNVCAASELGIQERVHEWVENNRGFGEQSGQSGTERRDGLRTVGSELNDEDDDGIGEP